LEVTLLGGGSIILNTKESPATDPNESLLNVKDLFVEYKTYDGIVYAVNGLNFSLSKGESIGIVGETGAGKTTTALSILSLVPSPVGTIKSGEIFFEGIDLLKIKEKEMRKLRGAQISMIFQNPMASLNPVHTIGDQIKEVILKHQSLGRKHAKKITADMLNKVGILDSRINEYPFEFSGGMQQRVSIAMALACKPKLLIADEPTTALDVTIQAQVLSLIKELKKSFDSSLILITHDFGLVAEVCDKIIVMYAGMGMESGSLEQVFTRKLHPYTEGLFNSIPTISSKVDRLIPIKGLSPDPRNLPKGCVFHPRCPCKMDICEREIPKDVEVDRGHFVQCWKYS
jgi:peptide/nickel transport system ATP-binding protein